MSICFQAILVGGIDMIDIIELEDGDYRIKHN